METSAELILICNSLDAGGIERVVSTLANEWCRQGRRISVITLHDRRRFYALDPRVQHFIVDRAGISWLAELLKKLKVRIDKFARAKPWLVALLGAPIYHLFSENLYRLNFHLYLAYEAWALRRILKRVDAPTIISFGTGINIITLKAASGLGRRVIISERNDPERLLRIRMWDYMARTLYRYADLVTANTQSALDSMEDFVERERLAFVPNPLAVPNGDGDTTHAFVQPTVLTVGRLVWDKAHDVLLDAFARTGDDLRDWRLSVVGDGRDREKLRRQAERLEISGRVDWHGIVSNPHAYYRKATMFVLPSRVEGMPNALLEAMSCGLPVIVSNGAPGPLEIVEDGETGLVVPVNDAGALAQAMQRLGVDRDLSGRLGEAGRNRVAEFALPEAMARWETILGWRT